MYICFVSRWWKQKWHHMKSLFFIFLFLSFGYQSIIAQHEVCSNGDRFLASQDYFAALEAYTTCYTLDTTSKKPLSSVAGCLYLLGDYQKAKEYYHQLESDTMFSTDAKIKLASIYESQQNLPKAIKYNLTWIMDKKKV